MIADRVESFDQEADPRLSCIQCLGLRPIKEYYSLVRENLSTWTEERFALKREHLRLICPLGVRNRCT
jgi:hypothetical protein